MRAVGWMEDEECTVDCAEWMSRWGGGFGFRGELNYHDN